MVTSDSTLTLAADPADPAESTQLNRERGPVAVRGWKIGRDALEVACLDVPPEQGELLSWLWQYCSQRDFDRARTGNLLRKKDGTLYSSDSIYQALTGRRKDVNLAPFCEAIAQLRSEVQALAPATGFIETDLFRQLKKYCELARRSQRIGFGWGDMNTGKTTCSEELARRDPSILYTRMPTRGLLRDLLQECARKLAMGARSTVGDLRDRVIEGLPTDGLWIIDEADQCFSAIKNTYGFATLDFIREAWDRRKIGILFLMDHAGRDQFIGAAPNKRLARLWRRRIPPLQLSDRPSAEDLDQFAAARGLPPATDEPLRVAFGRVTHTEKPLTLQGRVVKRDGLGVWLAVLDEALLQAQAAGRKITWGAVIKAEAEFSAHEAQ